MDPLSFVGYTVLGHKVVGHPQVVFVAAAKKWTFFINDGMRNIEVDPQTVRALALDEQLAESEKVRLAYKRALEGVG